MCTAATPCMAKYTTTTNALELLHDQHEEVENLIEEIEDSDDSSEKLMLFLQLADKFAAHAMIEEQLFYPSLLEQSSREDLVEATEEHLECKRLLADMLELDVADEHFDAKLAVLKENIRHHVHDEEEVNLFKLARRSMSQDELIALGSEMLALYESLLEQEPRNEVPAQISEAAELPMM